MFKVKPLILLISISSIVEFANCINVCGDWAKFKDIKCIKVLKIRVKSEEAAAACATFDENSTVISIHSQEEQDLVNNLLDQFVGTSVGAWIGMKMGSLFRSYEWLDGTDRKFTYWAEDAIKDGTLPCVKVLLNKRYLGKWMDESCERTAHVVCHKKQIFSLKTLRQVIEGMENQINILKESTIPMGFIYTQLPNQTSPEQLWPHMNWTEVTEEYSGLFFRAEGSESMPFGQIQHANQSGISIRKYISNSQSNGITILDIIPENNNTLEEGFWIPNAYNNYRIKWPAFITTEAEVRPVNTAVKIWLRTG